MTKRQINLRQMIVTVILALLVICILTSVTSKTLIAEASNAHIALNPIYGPAGISVSVNGGDFIGQTTISFNSVTVATTSAESTGFIFVGFTVPSVAPGVYDITASDSRGNFATTKFTVAASLTTPSYTYQPTYQPTQSPMVQSVGFWSPLVIAAIVGVAALVIIPMTLVLRGRGKQQKLIEKEPLTYQSRPYIKSNQPASRYNQPPTYGQNLTKPIVTNRNSQSSSTVQQPVVGKTCPHCKRVVKADYNICPYCYKRIR
jgi:hypothetical protein